MAPRAIASSSAEQLPELLKHCLDTPGVHLIDCPVDYSDNDRILNKEIKRAERGGLTTQAPR